MVSKLVGLLPNLEEAKLLDSTDAEASYVWKLALDVLGTSDATSKDDFEEAFYLVQSLADRTWEQINSGVFSEVPISTRKVYALSCFLRIVFLLLDSDDEKQLEECFRTLDNAVLVGCTTDLYGRGSDFLQETSKFLDEKAGRFNDVHFEVIEPLEYKECECDIDCLDCPTIEAFNADYFKPKKPVLLKNTIKHWPAMQKWRDPNYLLKAAGNRFVPIEIGSNYTTDNWSQEMSKFKEFFVRQFGSEKDSNEIEYLAQHELFDQIPTLKDDIRIPDYCCLGKNEPHEIDIKAWLGPEGTVSPMHQDPKHNILCQVFGSKKVILASVADSEFLYAHPSKMLENTSELDAENIDFEKYPLAKNAKFYHLKLQEGDALYIPPKWWHFIRSLNKSFSVSFWWE